MDPHYVTIKAAAPWTVANAKWVITQAQEEAKKQGGISYSPGFARLASTRH